MKGVEERDMMFGKLFGYLAIIRSGRLQIEISDDLSVELFNRILELHSKRGWIREVTSETMLALLETLDFKIFEAVKDKIDTILTVESVGEMSAWQLMLSLGLQLYQTIFPNYSDSIATLILPTHFFSKENILTLKPILMASTSGFPKVK